MMKWMRDLFGDKGTATASEWSKGMARLDAEMPLPAPRFRSRYCVKGAPGVCFPERKSKKCNVAPISKKA